MITLQFYRIVSQFLVDSPCSKSNYSNFVNAKFRSTALLNTDDAGRCVQSQRVSAVGPGLLLLPGELNKEGM